VRGLPDEVTREGVSPLADVEKLVIEGRYGRADLALRRLEALIPGLAQSADAETLLLALYGRALLLRLLGAGTQNAIAACDVLQRAAHERQAELWAATACALRARFRVDSGDIGGATADLSQADAETATADLSSQSGYRLLDGLAMVYAGLRLHDRADEVRTRIEQTIRERDLLDQAQHWSTWSGELAARAMEPLAGGAQDPHSELMGRAVEVAAKLDELPEAEVPATLRRGARGVRALSAAYRGRPSEALRLLGPDAFGTISDLPAVERQVVALAAMRAHALVGSLATARSLDDAASTAPATLPNLVLEVCRTRERLWLETYAGGDVIPILHRMTELLVRLGWRGMDLVADTARQALEHQALRTESRTDALTGVGNRRALDEELRQLLRFGPLPLALILVDVDHFKEVNDRFTHVVGDEVLRRVAASLSLQLRTDDQLLRYGGDEFVVLLPATGDEEAKAVAERMAAAVAARPWRELSDGLQVTVTTGVAAVSSLSGRRPDADAEKLFRRADERLLHSKREREDSQPGRSRGSRSPDVTVVMGGDSQQPIRREAAAQAASATQPVPDGPAEERRRPPEPGQSAAAQPVDHGPPADQGRTRPRDPSRTAMRPPARPETRARRVFDPDPELDSDAEASTDAAPRVSGRRDARPRVTVIGEDFEPEVGSLTQLRSRREARAASRPDIDPARETAAARDAAEATAAAREVAAAEAADHAADRERAEREAAEREAAERETQARQAQVRAAIAREAAERERAAREAEVREAAAREAAAREAERAAAAREAEARAAAEREAEARAAVARERAALEEAARVAAEREAAEREKAAREKAAREAAAREAAAREAAARERAVQEAAELARQQAAERARAEAEARAERERREAEARERAERARARAEWERMEAQALAAERAEEEVRARAAEAARAAERARIMAAARAAERIREEAYARAAKQAREAEQARMITEVQDRSVPGRQPGYGEGSGYDGGPQPGYMPQQPGYGGLPQSGYGVPTRGYDDPHPGYDDQPRYDDLQPRYGGDQPKYDDLQPRYGGDQQPEFSHPPPPVDSGSYDPESPIAAQMPLLRRAPLYDSNHYPDENQVPDYHGAGGQHSDANDSDVGENGTPRPRLDPFGLPTSRQAIIDLSARKRPRNPYSAP
jgi:diguanylate cyclase (GGDEF)-like protein